MLSLFNKDHFDMVILLFGTFSTRISRTAICIIYHKSKSIFGCFTLSIKFKVKLMVCVLHHRAELVAQSCLFQ